MSAFGIAGIVFVCCFAAALLGLLLHKVIPDQHLDNDSKDTVKLVMGLIATMSALVLGLLIASAKSSYDAQTSGLEQLAADIVQLDQDLTHYGEETKEIRALLRTTMIEVHDRVWSGNKPLGGVDPRASAEEYGSIHDAIQSLSAATEIQKRDREEALDMAAHIRRTRLLMFVESTGQLPFPFLVILVLWIATLFLGFGLFSRFNPTGITSLFVGTLCVAGAVFLILELNSPFAGLMRVSDAPVRYAISRLGQ